MTNATTRLTLATALCLALLAPFPAHADIDAGPTIDAAAAVQPTTATGADIPIDRNDLVGQVKDLKHKIDVLRNADKGERAVAIAGLLAGLLFLAIAGLKKATGMTKRGKRWIPRVLVGLGGVAAAASLFAGGQGWVDSLIIGVGPPLGILANEIWKSLK